MTPSPQDFHDPAAAAADAEGRLPHAFLLGRPAGLLQLRGSNLALWEEMFPVVPAADLAAVVAVAVDALADLGESRL